MGIRFSDFVPAAHQETNAGFRGPDLRLTAAWFFTFVAVAGLSGCSTLQVRVDAPSQRQQQREVRAIVANESPVASAAQWLEYGSQRNLPDPERLTGLLQAARIASPSASVSGSQDQRVYNAAIHQILGILESDAFTDMAVEPAHGIRNFLLETSGRDVLDPRTADKLIVASNVRIGGLHSRSVQSGLGVPMVAFFRRNSDALADQPGIPRIGLAVPVTAVLTFDGDTARLAFQRTLVSDHVKIDGKRTRLAADFSAPVAVLISQGKNRSIDIRAFLFTRQMFPVTGLFQFQEYDPKKIPVVFVHGLLSRPEAWTQALNGLLADPEVRARYQFWFFLYPTGLPVWRSAAELRSEIDRFRNVVDPDDQNPNLNQMVLVGHSMGGLISSLLVREGGERLWRQFSDKSPNSMNLSPQARRELDEMIYFSARKDVSRVIFVATPHRGSRLALNPIAGFFSRLVQLPLSAFQSERTELINAVREDMRSVFVAPANSVTLLRAESPHLISILNLPLAESVQFHSIIGDRGRGDTPNSSDGVVPFHSSHLAGAVSEKIVPSGHGVNEHPDGIEEIRRILAESLAEGGKNSR